MGEKKSCSVRLDSTRHLQLQPQPLLEPKVHTEFVTSLPLPFVALLCPDLDRLSTILTLVVGRIPNLPVAL